MAINENEKKKLIEYYLQDDEDLDEDFDEEEWEDWEEEDWDEDFDEEW